MSSAAIANVGEKVYWVIITLRNTKTGDSQKLRWADLPWPVRAKWDWYFKYRAALAQVQHPRWDVHLAWGSDIATPVQAATHRRNVLRARKAKITEIANKLERARREWKQMFPIENEAFWQKATAKLERLKGELAELEMEVARA